MQILKVRAELSMRTDGRIGMTKQIVSFRNFTNAPKMQTQTRMNNKKLPSQIRKSESQRFNWINVTVLNVVAATTALEGMRFVHCQHSAHKSCDMAAVNLPDYIHTAPSVYCPTTYALTDSLSLLKHTGYCCVLRTYFKAKSLPFAFTVYLRISHHSLHTASSLNNVKVMSCFCYTYCKHFVTLHSN